MSSKILFLAGSARKDSLNKKLAKAAYNIAVEKGADATFIDLKDYPMPIYDGDYEDENGLPEAAIALKKIFAEHDGIFIASPEYNSSFSPLLKNALDWISRTHEENEPPLVAFRSKVFTLSAASPGGYGGLRGLVPLRMMLGNILAVVLPDQHVIAFAHEAFDENDQLKKDSDKEAVERIVSNLIDVTLNIHQ